MTAQSTQAQPIAAAAAAALAEPVHGAEIIVPLNRLKASPKNARKVKHSEATLEGLAASIKAKGVLQPPVVEIERNADGAATGNYLVTIGEGRRSALRLLAKRKQIKRTHPVRVTVDRRCDRSDRRARRRRRRERRGSRQSAGRQRPLPPHERGRHPRGCCDP